MERCSKDNSKGLQAPVSTEKKIFLKQIAMSLQKKIKII